jgi:hypothetical protein
VSKTSISLEAKADARKLSCIHHSKPSSVQCSEVQRSLVSPMASSELDVADDIEASEVSACMRRHPEACMASS